MIGVVLCATSFLVHGGEIHELVVKGDVASVRNLLESRPDLVSARGFSGSSPLYFAVIADTKQIELIKLLLSYKADVNAKDAEGESPLHVAARRGSLEIIRLLVENGADVNDQGVDGSTPLHDACLRGLGREEAVKYLLGKGAKIDIRDKNGATPMHSAVSGENPEIVRILLAHGADPSARLPNGRTPLDIAQDVASFAKDNGNLLVIVGLLRNAPARRP